MLLRAPVLVFSRHLPDEENLMKTRFVFAGAVLPFAAGARDTKALKQRG